ncbi:MAG: 6-phosphogluconolactonase [Planctomycetota bacterium]
MLKVFKDHQELREAAAAVVAAQGEGAVRRTGVFRLVLSGGRTPEETYRRLAAPPYRDMSFWRKTQVYWGDERCVPVESGLRNYTPAKETLLDFVDVPGDSIFPICADGSAAAESAAMYARILPARLDLVLLGVGEDGHIASLFPRSSALEERERRVVCVRAPVNPNVRITLTPIVLREACFILILVSGVRKAEALKRVFAAEGDYHETPGRLVRDARWFVDEEAAKLL